MTKEREALTMALEALSSSQDFTEASSNGKLRDGWGNQLDEAEKAITAIKEALAQPEQEPVGTIIEELEHDGEGWCSKVRWLYNPVPVGEMLSWGKSK